MILTKAHKLKNNVVASDRMLVDAIENYGLRLEEFTHENHIKLAYCYLVKCGFDGALVKMKQTLVKFLQHHGVSSNKFHATLTQGWLTAVFHFMHNSDSTSSADEFIQNNPVLLNKNILLSHYSHERLFSDKARKNYVHPDLNPFPEL